MLPNDAPIIVDFIVIYPLRVHSVFADRNLYNLTYAGKAQV